MNLSFEVTMMKRSTSIFAVGVCAGLLNCLSPALLAQRDQGIPAREALATLAKQFGEDRIEWVVEMRGFDGIPDPPEWEVFMHDPNTRYLTREYWVGDREATNEGAADEFFPDRSPFGYFRISELKLDSKAAFTIAEGEARKARMGFDKLNYFLRCREFSREPVWMLELVDASDDLVGKVYISGDTGEVLRTVWIFRGARGRPDGGPLVVDTAAPRPGGGTSQGARSETAPPSAPSRPAPDEPDPLSPRPPAPGGLAAPDAEAGARPRAVTDRPAQAGAGHRDRHPHPAAAAPAGPVRRFPAYRNAIFGIAESSVRV
jgi:hypothetical protein